MIFRRMFFAALAASAAMIATPASAQLGTIKSLPSGYSLVKGSGDQVAAQFGSEYRHVGRVVAEVRDQSGKNVGSVIAIGRAVESPRVIVLAQHLQVPPVKTPPYGWLVVKGNPKSVLDSSLTLRISRKQLARL